MNGTIFLKGKKVTLFIGDATKIPEVTIELNSPQFIFEGDKVTIVDATPPTVIKK